MRNRADASPALSCDGALRAAVLSILLLLLVWAAFFLFTLPAVGVADRGDYYRVARPAGILVEEGRTPPEHPLLQRAFPVAAARSTRGTTTAVWVAVVAKHLSLDPESFDLRQLGGVYLLLVAASVALALRFGAPPALCLVLTWVLVDPSYSAYFNSLYSEPPALVAVFGIALWLAGPDAPRALFGDGGGARSVAATAAVTALLLFGAFSRLPMCGLPGLVLGVLLVEWWRHARSAPLRPAAAAVLVATTLLPLLYFTAGPGPRFPAINDFNATFLGAASLSDDPGRVLEGMGLPSRYSELVGKNYFAVHPSPALEAELGAISPVRRGAAYFADARILARAARRLAEQLGAGATRPSFETADAPPRDSALWRFTRLRIAILGEAWPLVGAALLAMGGWVAGACRGRVRAIVPPRVLVFLLLLCLAQMVIAVLGDGFFSLGRHLLLARYAFDAACAILLLEMISAVARAGQRAITRDHDGQSTA